MLVRPGYWYEGWYDVVGMLVRGGSFLVQSGRLRSGRGTKCPVELLSCCYLSFGSLGIPGVYCIVYTQKVKDPLKTTLVFAVTLTGAVTESVWAIKCDN